MKVLNLINGVMELTEEEQIEETIKNAKTDTERNLANALKMLYDAESLEELVYGVPKWKM